MNISTNIAIILVSLILGLSTIGTAALLKKTPTQAEKFELRQEGPVFVRFDKSSGQLCYTGIAPNGHFIAETWLCMNGTRAKQGLSIQAPEAEGANESSGNSNNLALNKESGSQQSSIDVDAIDKSQRKSKRTRELEQARVKESQSSLSQESQTTEEGKKSE
jgi:hypothetical protein